MPAMDEFIICDVCMEVFDGGLRCPRMFTCGHSFCSFCIQKLLTTSSFCPTCKIPVGNESLETISINYILKKMAEKYSFKSANEPSGNIVREDGECKTHHHEEPLPSKGYCKVHKAPKRFRCMTCKMWICGDCSVISHKRCKILLIIEAIEEMKEKNSSKITKHLATIFEGEVDSLNLLGHYKDILGTKNEELQCYQQKIIVLKDEICEVNRNIEKVSDLQTVLASLKEKLEYQMKATNAASSANDLDRIEEKLTEHFSSLKELTEDLKFYKSSMLQNAGNKNDFFDNKEKLMASVTAGEKILVTANKEGITRYGELDVKDGIFRIHSMHQTNNSPSSLCITLDDCLTTMTGRKEWPTKIFLQLSANCVPLEDVIIRLQKSSKEATKTVLPSCLFGEEGKSFKRVCVKRYFGRDFEGKFICSEDYFPVPSDVDDEALLKEMKKKKWNKGEMGLSLRNWNNGMLFRLMVFVKKINWELELIPTGQVEKGIEVVKDAYRRLGRGEEVKVLNCGWALN